MTALTMLTKTLELPANLPAEDGEPLESNWHRIQINLLVDLTHQMWAERDDYFAGGNMFIYFSARQSVTHDYRGPDFFVVTEVEPKPERESWNTWEEDGRFPDVIVELLSPSTANADLTVKKRLYERTFRTPEYFAYDPDTERLRGWRLDDGAYRELKPNAQGFMQSTELGVWLGQWAGEYEKVHAVWLRFYSADGQLLPTGQETAEARVMQLEAELKRLRAEFDQRKPAGDN